LRQTIQSGSYTADRNSSAPHLWLGTTVTELLASFSHLAWNCRGVE